MANNKDKMPRNHRISFTLNEKEYKVFQRYMKKYNVNNKANLIRKALFTHILEQFDKDYPTLFNNKDNNE